MVFYFKVLCLLLGTLILNTPLLLKTTSGVYYLGGGFSNRGKGLFTYAVVNSGEPWILQFYGGL